MAETSELVIALVASEEPEKAHQLFNTLYQWRDTDGGFWTGYVFRDQTIWPAEKTTWTAGAVLLAADALLARMQTSTASRGMRAAFAESGERLGKSAVAATRSRG